MTVNRPTSTQFFDAHDLLVKYTSQLESLFGIIAQHQTPDHEPVAPLPMRNLLAALQQKPIVNSTNIAAARTEISRIEGVIESDAAIGWVRSQKAFQKLEDSLSRKAKLEPASKFAKSVAAYQLMMATLIGMAVHSMYLSNKQKPGEMSRADWDEAIAAVQTLRRLEKDKGLKLWKVFTGTSVGVFWGWAEKLEERLRSSKESAKKPHDDGFTSDRDATRRFAEWLLLFFDDAPPNMVEKFADLIGYDTSSIPRQLARWIEASKTDSLA